MPVPTVTVTCRASSQSGAAIPGAIFTFKLNLTEKYNGFVVPATITGKADGNGVCVVQLFPNALGSTGSAYTTTGINPKDGRRFLSGMAVIPNYACNLEDVLDLPYYAVTGTVGLKGAPGDKGPSGNAGATGANGLNGTAGATGAPGFTGVAGAPGATGATGATGPTGASGAPGGTIGATGATGLTGTAGTPGTPGTTGATGATGPAGATGAAGAAGAAGGATGATGPAGPAGATGAAGTSLDSINRFTKNQSVATVALVYAATLAIDASLSNIFRLVLTGNVTVQNPINMTDGMMIGLILRQDGAGSYTATFGSAYKFAGGTMPVLSTAVGSIDYLTFLNTTDGLLLINFSKGFAATTTTAATPVPSGFMAKVGTNLSGMEWAAPGLRYGTSTLVNIAYTVPRAADVQYLASSGFGKVRLPIQWELLQPVLASSNPNTATRAIIGTPGAFNLAYQSYITGVLDACAAAGTKCIIDLHNYCRYQDFVFEADGSVIGLTVPSDPLIPPYTSNNNKVRKRIFSLAPGSSLTRADFNDFWTRAAAVWKGHAGLGGYGLMNEPSQMPVAGGTVAYDDPYIAGNVQDYSIWTTFAISAYNAIRVVDPTGTIYVGGNDWQNVMQFSSVNPGFPIPGATNVIYDVHMYLDATSGGFRFDWDYEVALGYSAGLPNQVVNEMTGRDRLLLGTNWANAQTPPVKLALTEIGMPIDDVRWQNSFKNAMVVAKLNDVEVYTWMGGNHWPIHAYPINHVPQWHQNKTVEPLVSGRVKESGSLNTYTLFDDGTSYALSGTAGTITVYIRGNTAMPLTINVTRTGGGTLSKSTLTIPAGANGQDTFTYTPVASEVATITYSGPAQVPPARKFYSLADPVAYASTSLPDAALALMAKYKVSKWVATDAYTDYMLGAPSGVNAASRAISDSGFGSTPGNPMEMLCWHNESNGALGIRSVPKIQAQAGVNYIDLTAYGTLGLWCKKRVPVANNEPNPTNKMLFNLQDPHFAIAAIRLPNANTNGVIFQAGTTEELYYGEISLNNGVPQAKWVDSALQTVTRPGTALALNQIHTVSMQAGAGAGGKTLRVNGVSVNSAAATLAASPCNQMLMGWGYVSYFPRDGFQGHLFAAAAGKGEPTNAEMNVMETYIANVAGTAATVATATPVPVTVTMPVPLNNLIAVVGDSRTSIVSTNGAIVEAQDKTVYGYASWLEAASGYRAKVIGNYGVNANTLDQMITRLTSIETRGQILNSTASVFVFLGGVNNTTEAIGTVGPKYQSLINQLTASGKICVVMNEIPNNDTATVGPIHLGRRTYLDSAVYTNDARVVRFNSYDLMAQSPTSFLSKTGYYGDTLHPSLKGHRELGTALGALFNQLFATFPVRNAMATVKGPLAPMFDGTTGALGAGSTGALATDWNSEAIPAGLTVAYSKGTDSNGFAQQIITVTGTPTAAVPTYASWSLDNYAVDPAQFASNDLIEHGLRCVIDVGSTGLVSVSPAFAINDNTNAVYNRGASFAINIYDNSSTISAPWLGGDMRGEAFDYVIKSPQVAAPAGYTASASRSVNPRVTITFRGGAAVNAVIRLSRSTIHKNL